MFKGQLFVLGLAIVTAVAAEQKQEAKEVVTKTFRPEQRKFSEDLVGQLKVPAGFKVNVFARELGNARWMLPLADGRVLLSCFKEGRVFVLQDKDGDGVAEAKKLVATVKDVHGLAARGDTIYLASTTKLLTMTATAGGGFSEPKEFGTLPDGGQHPRRTLGFGPDGLLYVSVGSTCNACKESNPEHAAMLRMQADGSQRTVFASGLRNTIGFAWHPETKEFWGMDHGSDDRGNDIPGEELNLLLEGGDYGWPYCYNQNEVDLITNKPEQGTKEERCAKAKAPALLYQAHSAPIGFVFYTSEKFPADYRNDAFVSFRGSWNRDPAVGYKVCRVRFKDGKPTAFEDFLTGFLLENGKAEFARLAGLAVAPDGSLLVADDENGVIYRVSYAKP